VAEQMGIPFTLMPHAVDIFLHRNRARNNLAKVTDSEHCRCLYAIGQYHKDFYIDMGCSADKIIICRPYQNEEDYLVRSLEPTNRPIRQIISISRFQEKKGLHLLIGAFRKLEDPELRLTLYGYGPLKNELERLAQGDGRIRIAPGPTSKEECRTNLAEADLFVLPCIETADGDKDGLPTVLREAMAAGVPILTTPIASIPDLITAGETGFFAKPGDIESLVGELERILRLKETKILKVRQHAQFCIRCCFSGLSTIDRLLEVWKKG